MFVKYSVSVATVIILPHPDSIVCGYEKYVVDGGEVVSWERGTFEPAELENMLPNNLYVPDPVDYDMVFVLEEMGYCEFRVVIAASGFEDKEKALETAEKVTDTYKRLLGIQHTGWRHVLESTQDRRGAR